MVLIGRYSPSIGAGSVRVECELFSVRHIELFALNKKVLILVSRCFARAENCESCEVRKDELQVYLFIYFAELIMSLSRLASLPFAVWAAPVSKFTELSLRARRVLDVTLLTSSGAE